MNSEIQIGTCGFRTKKSEYVGVLKCVEIQHTFYNPPMVKTLEGWRAEMPPDFEFTLKAWQLVTHESSSPTYRRLRKPLNQTEAEDAGFFKDTFVVKGALDVTIASAKALGARTVLFQCPEKFRENAENIARMRKFFKKHKREGLNFAWEPRGDWNPEVVGTLCEELELWHAVDPFKVPTVTPDRCYYRLHGLTRWHYTFEEGELEELVSLLPEKGLSYVFFNNITMLEDALRFEKIIERS
jgi:uncharacterized protein YecE (DUF72 family)